MGDSSVAARPNELHRRRPSVACAIARAELNSALKRSSHPVVWVHAPAGAGKTLGVASFVARHAERCLWYTIDSDDRDPANLAAELGCTLLSGSGTSDHVRWPAIPEPVFELEAYRLFRRLIERAQPPICIVLDNFQAAETAPGFVAVVRGFFAAFVEVALKDSRIVVTSRSRPPRELSRFVVQDAIDVLAPALLSVTKAEARKLLALLNKHGRGWSDEQVAAIVSASGGWTAAAALFARHGGTDFNRAPADAITLIDYVTSELFVELSAPAQQALQLLAFFPCIAAGLVERIEPQLNRTALLTELERAGVPMTVHDDGSIRLHDLVRDALRAVFFADAAAEARASGLLPLLAVEGLLGEAAELSARLELWPQFGELIKAHAPALMESGRAATLDAALLRLPPASVAADPWLLYWSSCCALIDGRPDAKEGLERAYKALVAQGDRVFALLAACGMIQAILLAGENLRAALDWVAVIERTECSQLPLAIEARIRSSCLKAHFMVGFGDEKSLAAADRALPITSADIPVADAVSICGDAMSLYLAAGRMDEAKAAYRRAECLARRATHDAVTQSWLLAQQATFAASTGDLECALRFGEQAIELATTTGARGMATTAAGCSAIAATALGRYERAGSLLAGIEQVMNSTYERGSFHCARADLRLNLRAFEEALADAQATARDAEAVGFQLGHCAGLCLQALALGALGRMAPAREALALARSLNGSFATCLEQTYQAFIEAALDVDELGRDGAGPAIERALHAARRYGYSGGPPGPFPRQYLEHVVGASLELGIEPELAEMIIRRRRLSPPLNDTGPVWPWPVVIRTFGAFSLAKSSNPDDPNAPTPSALLELLIAKGGEPHSIARLARELWASRDPAASRSAFDTAVHRARRALGDETLVVVIAGAVRLDRARIWTDVWALPHLVEAIDRLPVHASRAVLVPLAARLLALYRGPFCGAASTVSILRCRDQAERRFVGAVQVLCAHFTRAGEVDSRRDLLEHAVERAEHSEALHQALVTTWLELGCREQAERAIERCRSVLRSTRVRLL